MAAPKAAWGIEIGAFAIKALRLERTGEDVRVVDFAVIPHKKVLTTPDLDQDEMVRLGLGQFISQKNLEGEHLVMSVPGHTAFARFAKLPPVEPKKVPDIVKFEAVQQIPFPIDDVEWDYQTFTSEDTPEIEVGIFAITRERVQQRLGLYSELGLSPEVMTLSPVAVYNAMNFDHSGHKAPVVYIDIGTSATDVIVAEAGRCWIRTFPLGGTHFTEAIASAFKLSYSKAEKLKLEASESKYAKQIMQAMRPVFSDLLQDLQRSIGYYQSLHRDSELKTMVGIGSTFKIPGLRKFLGQQLQIDVLRLDEYKRIAVTGREAASFAENAVNMASAYGLALQGIGMAQIDANVVPVKTLREQMWHSKTKWFAAAAVIAILGAGITLYRPMVDRSMLAPVPPAEVSNVLTRATQLRQNYEELKAKSDIGASATNMINLLDHRDVWPHLIHDSANALASTKPQPELLSSNPELIFGIDPKQRRLVQLNALAGEYLPPEDAQGKRRIRVRMDVELSHENPVEFLNTTVAAWLRDNAEPTGPRANVPYRILPDTLGRLASYEEVRVDAGGQETTRQSEPGASGAPDAPKISPPRQTRPPKSTPRTGGAGGLRNNDPGETTAAPGTESGGFSGKGGDGSSNGFGGSSDGGDGTRSDDPGRRRTGSPRGQSPADEPKELKDLNELAPVPARPKLYPPSSTYYRVPITFEIELIDTNAATPPAATASGQPQGQGAEA
jgi:type IV pilus assembly protein PilM